MSINQTINKKRRIASVLGAVTLLKNVEYKVSEDHTTIEINHAQEYVPNFVLRWCDNSRHYRVYIHIATREKMKTNAGYSICVIGSSLTASLFVGVYNFIHKHRANNKSLAE